MSSKGDTFTPDHILLNVPIKTTGDYKLKFWSSGEMIFGNISIKQYAVDDSNTLLNETFAGLGGYAPAANSGWFIYDDDGVQRTQSATLGSGPRILPSSGTNLTNIVYLGYGSGYLTYGEESSGKTLALESAHTYRISYYAAKWDNNSTIRSLTCQIKYGDDMILNRTDALAGRTNAETSNVEFTVTPDFIEAIFTASSTGNHTLKFQGKYATVANITIEDITSSNVVYESVLDSNFGYATLCLNRDVAIPSNVWAYVGQFNDAQTEITLTRKTGVLPAKTPVILKGNPGATIQFVAATASDDDKVGNQALCGTLFGTEMSSDSTYYTLGYTSSSDESTIGFYPYSALALRSNKAYIAFEKPVEGENVPSIRFRFDAEEPGNVSAIEQVQIETPMDAPIFDINGRRVTDMSKPGLYIVGDRKVLVR